MAAPKLSQKQLQKLFQEGEDKRTIEALRSKLADKLSKDPGACKKAALILENWINKKGR